MKSPPSTPLIAELVEPAPRPDPRAGLVTVLLAAAPLAARAAWWWWSHSRRRTLTVSARPAPEPAAVERTEIEMVRKTLGRWRIRVVDTRWSVPPAPVAAAAQTSAPPPPGLVRAVLRLSTLALRAGPPPQLLNRRNVARLAAPRREREP
ncbi:MAG TPA: hypothetical protein VMV09_02005 [Candidatus Saccharimonadales bacterium]|nr:hypothetical protein [Candidatus Saccharimonadales bacterium]